MKIAPSDLVYRTDIPGTYRVLNTHHGLALIQPISATTGTRVVPISRLAQAAAVPTT